MIGRLSKILQDEWGRRAERQDIGSPITHCNALAMALVENGVVDAVALREEFLRLLTVDSETSDRRRKEYNQAIFAPEGDGGYAIFTSTDVGMVMEKFDKAIKEARRS